VTAQHLRQLLANIDAAEPMRRRAVQQAISEASAWWWAWRAEQFHAAAARPGDYPGGPVDWETGQPLSPPPSDPGRDAEVRLTALACRQKAALLEAGWLDE
jgi:hypothetical protein